MSLILCIETSTHICSAGISRQGKIQALKESSEKNIHAASITLFVKEVCSQAGVSMDELDAVAVGMGPGSYTGLRIGVSAAKGFCYGLGIPLIAVPSLQAMAYGAISAIRKTGRCLDDHLFCPMIDARRMEVYTALFNSEYQEVRGTEAIIIAEDSFGEELKNNTIYYFGDGADKCRYILRHERMIFLEGVYNSAANIALLADLKFRQGAFENLAYFEPFYLKDFIAAKPRVKGL